MASPVKAFIDPKAGLSILVEAKLPIVTYSYKPVNQLCSVGGMPILVKNTVFKPVSSISIMYTTKFIDPTIAVLPKPPVGKMLVSTYPPIYHEKTNYTGAAETPRIYPPIYTYHVNK